MPVAAQIAADITAIRDRVLEVACTILVIIEGIVGFIAVLMIAIAAIRWIVAQDPADRAEVKSKLFNILVGLIIVILALEIANVIGEAAGVISSTQDCSVADVGATEDIREVINGPVCVIIRVLQLLIGVIGSMVLMVAGIRWMTSETPEDRAEARNLAVNVIVGVLLFLIGIQFLDVLFDLTILSYGFSMENVTEFECSDSYLSSVGVDLGGLGDFTQYTACILFYLLQGIAGVLAVVLVIIAGIMLSVSPDQAQRNRVKGLLVAVIIGVLVFIIGGQYLADLVNLGSVNALSPSSFNPTQACGGVDTPQEIIDLITYTVCTIKNVLVSIASLVAAIALLVSAFVWITSGNTENRHKARQAAIAAVAGLLVVIIGLQFLSGLFGSSFLTFECDGGDASGISNLISGLLCLVYNALRSVVAIVAAIMLLYGGFLLITSSSGESRSEAKNIIAGAVIGFIVAMVAVQLIFFVVQDYEVGQFTCDDEAQAYYECIKDCEEPSPIPASGSGGTGGTGTTGTTVSTGASAQINSVSHNVDNAAEEINMTVSVENTGSSDQSFEVNILSGGSEMESETVSVSAGSTNSVLLSSHWDPTWDVCDLTGGSYEVRVVSGGAEADSTTKSVSLPASC